MIKYKNVTNKKGEVIGTRIDIEPETKKEFVKFNLLASCLGVIEEMIKALEKYGADRGCIVLTLAREEIYREMCSLPHSEEDLNELIKFAEERMERMHEENIAFLKAQGMAKDQIIQSLIKSIEKGGVK